MITQLHQNRSIINDYFMRHRHSIAHWLSLISLLMIENQQRSFHGNEKTYTTQPSFVMLNMSLSTCLRNELLLGNPSSGVMRLWRHLFLLGECLLSNKDVNVLTSLKDVTNCKALFFQCFVWNFLRKYYQLKNKLLIKILLVNCENHFACHFRCLLL